MNWIIEGFNVEEFKKIAQRVQAEAVVKYVIENARSWDGLPYLDLRSKNFFNDFAAAYELVKEHVGNESDYDCAVDSQKYEQDLKNELYDFAAAVMHGKEPKDMSPGLQMAIQNGYSKWRRRQLELKEAARLRKLQQEEAQP